MVVGGPVTLETLFSIDRRYKNDNIKHGNKLDWQSYF